MGLWTAYKRRQQLSRVKLRVLTVERLIAPVGMLRGRLALETDSMAMAEIVFHIVREVQHEKNGAARVCAFTLATARHGAAIALRAREPAVVEFQFPYNLTGIWPLTWRLPPVLVSGEPAEAGEAYFLEALIDAGPTIHGARDRALITLAAS